MKKLIALRPIHYRGRNYKHGDALPVNDAAMTAAWLKAGSAAWEAEKRDEPPVLPSPELLRREAERQAAEVLEAYGVDIADEAGNFVGKEALTEQVFSVPLADALAAGTLRALGVELTDGDGNFVGGERLKEQLRALAQELLPEYEDVIPPPPGTPAQGELPEEHVLDVDPAGHFTKASLSRLTKAELLELAEDMGVDLSGCRTNAERVDALAAVDAETALDCEKPGRPPEDLPPEEPAE